MRNAFIDTLHELAKEDPRVILLVADNGAIVFDRFREEFPDRFLNCGICESTMVSVAAGLASCGRIPFIYTITPFLIMRAFEQVRNDVCMQGMNVKIIGIGGGIRYSTLGPTHHAIEDIAIMKVLPRMVIVSPADPAETRRAVRAIKDLAGPVYLRMGTTHEPAVYQKECDFRIGQGIVLREGRDVTMIGTGSVLHDMLRAADLLRDEGVSAQVINIHTIKPLDGEIIIRAAAQTKRVLTVEEHNVWGGLGESVAAILAERFPGTVRFKRMGIQDVFCSGYGSHEYLKKRHGLSVKNIAAEAMGLVNASGD